MKIKRKPKGPNSGETARRQRAVHRGYRNATERLDIQRRQEEAEATRLAALAEAAVPT